MTRDEATQAKASPALPLLTPPSSTPCHTIPEVPYLISHTSHLTPHISHLTSHPSLSHCLCPLSMIIISPEPPPFQPFNHPSTLSSVMLYTPLEVLLPTLLQVAPPSRPNVHYVSLPKTSADAWRNAEILRGRRICSFPVTPDPVPRWKPWWDSMTFRASCISVTPVALQEAK